MRGYSRHVCIYISPTIPKSLIRENTLYLYILFQFENNVNKLIFLLCTILAVGAMLVIPNSSIIDVAKAGSCAASINAHGSSVSTSGSTSGSCSIGGSLGFHRLGGAIGAITFPEGGKSQSTCTSTSASQSSSDFDAQSSNDAVSCSSHRP
jgi:hypothetical protein